MAGGSVFLSILSALLFWACNAVQITQVAQQSSRWKTLDKNYYYQLVPESIENEWKFKIESRALEYSVGYLKAAFWLVFMLPMIEMSWVLSKRGTRSLPCNVGIAVFTLAGSWSKWFSTILWTGMYISFIELAKNFNLNYWLTSELANTFNVDEDGLGWTVLEVNHISFRGMTVVVDAAEWLCLSVIFILTFYSVNVWRKEDYTTFGGKWNALGLFLGVLCFIQFILEIVGAEGIGLAWLFFILYAALFRLVLFPMWIVIMGFQLASATAKEFDAIDTRQLELSELQALNASSPVQPASNANFTIDEDDLPVDPNAPSSPPAEAFASINNELKD